MTRVGAASRTSIPAIIIYNEIQIKIWPKIKLVGDVTETGNVTETRHTVLGIVKYIHNIKISI